MNPTILRLGVRSLLGRRRGIMLFVLPVVTILLAIVVRAISGADLSSANIVLESLGLRVLLPLIALICSTGLLAPEIDDGSIVYLLAKPLSRVGIVANKLLVAVGCTVVFAVLPLLVAGFVLVTGEPGLVLAYVVGSVAGVLAYCALFTWLSTLTRHAVVLGLIYLLVWEGLIGGLVSGVRWVGIGWWVGSIAEAVNGKAHLTSSDLSTAYAVIATVVVLVGLGWLAARRLQGFNLTGDE